MAPAILPPLWSISTSIKNLVSPAIAGLYTNFRYQVNTPLTVYQKCVTLYVRSAIETDREPTNEECDFMAHTEMLELHSAYTSTGAVLKVFEVTLGKTVHYETVLINRSGDTSWVRQWQTYSLALNQFKSYTTVK